MMNIRPGPIRVSLLLLLAALAAACATTEGPRKLDPVPLTEEEIEFLKKLDDPETFSLIQETPVLMKELGNLLSAWLESSLAKDSPKQVRIYTNLGELLTRRVYVNFDAVMEQLHAGPPPNRVIAAAALGFSRIPENTTFPQKYSRAVDALVDVLDCGDDAIVQNALLGLYNLAAPETPLQTILDIMVQHHDPNVRANASLALQAIVTPDESDLVMPYILPGLKDDEPKVRNHCITVAHKLKGRSAITALIELLDDPYALIQANAAKALGEMGEPSLCRHIIPKLDSRFPIVREYALLSLRKLSGEDHGFETEDWNDWWEDYSSTGG